MSPPSMSIAFPLSELWGRTADAAAIRDLWWALRTRVLTDEEMLTVRKAGPFLAFEGNSYRESELHARFDAALIRQAELRILAERGR